MPYNQEAIVSLYIPGKTIDRDVIARQYYCVVKGVKCDFTLIWDILYHHFDARGRVKTSTIRSLDEDSKTLQALFNRVLSEPLAPRYTPPPNQPIETVRKYVTVEGLSQEVILRLNRQGMITRFLVTLDAEMEAIRWHDLDLVIRFDRQFKPQVSVPLAPFFGSEHFNVSDQRGITIGFCNKTQTGFSFYPMPFFRQVLLTISSRSHQDISMLVILDISPLPSEFQRFPEDVGYFHATRRQTDRTTKHDDMILLEETGSWGHVVGVNLYLSELLGYVEHKGRFQIQEGDPKLRVDGSEDISVTNSGTEDFFHVAHGWADLGRSWNTATGGFSAIGGRNSRPRSEWDHWDRASLTEIQAYRQLVADCWPFSSEASLRFGHGSDALFTTQGWKENELIAAMGSVVFWYGQSKNRGVVSDSFTVHDEQAASKNNYTCAPAARLVYVDGGYFAETEGTPDFVPHLDLNMHMLESNSTISFRMKTSAANRGAVLRRRLYFSALYPHQGATVIVDGVKVGVWFLAGGNAGNFINLRESSFQIHEKITRNKTVLQIELRVITRWTAGEYQLHTVF